MLPNFGLQPVEILLKPEEVADDKRELESCKQDDDTVESELICAKVRFRIEQINCKLISLEVIIIKVTVLSVV